MASITHLTLITTRLLHHRAETTAPPQVIGFTSTFGTYSPWACLTGTWYPVSGFGRCCPTTQGDCPMYTTCLEGSILANDQFQSTCTGSSSQTACNTGTVYDQSGDPNPRLYVGCWPSWTGGDWKATRTVPVTISEDITTLTSVLTPSLIPPPVSTHSTQLSSAGRSSGDTLSPGTLAAIIISIVFGLTLAIGCGCLTSYFWARRKRRSAARKIRKAQLEFATQKGVRAGNIQATRPQSRPAELEEWNETAEVADAQVVAGGSGFHLLGHQRGPSEVDSREVRRPSEVEGHQIRRISEVNEKEAKRLPKAFVDGEIHELRVSTKRNIKDKDAKTRTGSSSPTAISNLDEEEEEIGIGDGPRNMIAQRNINEEEGEVGSKEGPSNATASITVPEEEHGAGKASVGASSMRVPSNTDNLEGDRRR